jgi:hypothetical protein
MLGLIAEPVFVECFDVGGEAIGNSLTERARRKEARAEGKEGLTLPLPLELLERLVVGRLLSSSGGGVRWTTNAVDAVADVVE